MGTPWTAERRELQRQVALRSRLWEKSTGPKTAEGKRKVSQNARKHGLRSRATIEQQQALNEALRDLRRALAELEGL